MNEKYERQMKKGVLDMLMLKLLLQQPKYGYQLISEMKEKSGGVFVLKEGTLYPVLYRLEDEKLVESRWSEPEGKQLPRKYYAITEKGKDTLAEMIRMWNQISEGIERIVEEEAYDC
ncbi:MAG: PadR family transcriptional regulator [Lachnospiraceae bacterium]|nr:PadR family transcriptional regulator [Lachnospiraceae bacterium]